MSGHERRMREQRRRARSLSCLALFALVACSRGERAEPDAGDAGEVACSVGFDARSPARTEDVGLRINEVLAANDGAAVDELGESDDFIELLNVSDAPIALGALWIADSDHQVRLPARTLAPGEHLLLWADDAPDQVVTSSPGGWSCRWAASSARGRP